MINERIMDARTAVTEAPRNLARIASRVRVLSLRTALAALVAVGASGIRPLDASAQQGSSIVRIIRTLGEPWNQCGQTEGLEEWAANEDVMVQPVRALMSDGTTQDTTTESLFSVDEDCPIKGVFPIQPAASAPVQSFDCVLEVPLGTASRNGAVVNEYTATQRVIVHGDMEINGEFRADSNGTTGLIQDVNASPSNPARIRTINPAWGGDVAAFCDPADMAANIQQGVDNLRSQGMRPDVIPWPGPKQGVAASTYVAPASAPSSSTEGCVPVDVALGTAKGGSTNEYIARQYVIAHGDVSINGEFRADDNGATGLVQRVHASVSNPARITANPAWGGHVVAFCNADDEANVQQGLAGLRAQGLRADVIEWPGTKQR